MGEQSLKSKTAKGLFWGGISNGLQQIFSLVFGVILARILTPEDYGLVGMLAIFSVIASSIQESGFTNALTNIKEIKHENYNAVFWFSFISGVVIYIILFLAAPLIAKFYNVPELTTLSRILFLAFVINGVGIAQYAYMFKVMMVKEQAKVNIIALLMSGIIGVTLAFSGFSYWALVLQTITFAAMSTLLRCYFSPWRPSLKINFTPLKEMFGFSSKLFVSNIFYQISNNVFSVFLGKYYNPTQVGYYSQGQKWMYMGQTFIGGMINSVAQPVFVQVVENKERQLNVIRKMIRFGAFVSFPLMLGLAFVSEEFIIIAIGEKWSPAIPFLQLFCLWGAFAYLWTLFSNLLITYGKSSTYMWVIIFICSLQLSALFFMLPYGIFPMLIIYISTLFLGMILQYYFVKRIINLSPWQVLKDIIPYVLATFASFFIAWFVLKKIENIYVLFISKILISVFVYIFVVWCGNSSIFKEVVRYITKRKTL